MKVYIFQMQDFWKIQYINLLSNKKIKHIIILCSAINYIDSSALESLEFINNRLNEAGVKLHLSEVKGPVMDQLKKTNFLEELTGEIYLTNFQAFLKLEPKWLKSSKIKNINQYFYIKYLNLF